MNSCKTSIEYNVCHAKKKMNGFIATSLDGYIATPERCIDFLKIVQKEGEDYGYSECK